MTITLIRHGKPTVSLRERIRAQDFRAFIERYEAAGIENTSLPSEAAKVKVAEAQAVLTSDRARAIDSARILAPQAQLEVDPLFRETDSWMVVPLPLRLSALQWAFVSRLLWFAGWARGCESLAAAKHRAHQAAQRLIARSHCGSVVLVAHGGINKLIAKELLKLGWTGPRSPDFRHWGHSTYYPVALGSRRV
jgi:broad specificity phosphatase PhoE